MDQTVDSAAPASSEGVDSSGKQASRRRRRKKRNPNPTSQGQYNSDANRGSTRSSSNTFRVGEPLRTTENLSIGNSNSDGIGDAGYRAFMGNQGSIQNPCGTPGSRAAAVFDQTIWSNYVIGIQNTSRARLNLNVIELRNYIANASFLFAEIMNIKAQRKLVQENIACPELKLRVQNFHTDEIERVIRNASHTLVGMWMPPRLIAHLRAYAGLYYANPGKNAPILQILGLFATSTPALLAQDVMTVDAAVSTMINDLTTDTMNGVTKATPEWRIKAADLEPQDIKFDEQFLNIWVNKAQGSAAGLNPVNQSVPEESATMAIYRCSDEDIDRCVTPYLGFEGAGGPFPGLTRANIAAPPQVTYDNVIGDLIPDVTPERTSSDPAIWANIAAGEAPQRAVRQTTSGYDLIADATAWLHHIWEPDFVAGQYNSRTQNLNIS